MQTLFLSITTYLTDLLFPAQCGGCGEIGTFFCSECLSHLPPAEPSKNSFITALFDYQDQVLRKTIWKFKYKNARSIAKCFGGLLYDEIISEIGDDLRITKDSALLLIPIPLHKKRMRERGYNQSELLSREIIKHNKGKILEHAPNALLRTRETKPQAKKEKRAARFENLRDAFETIPELVHGKHIILIDDVTTTGATLSEARKVLLSAGARTVRAYAVAH